MAAFLLVFASIGAVYSFARYQSLSDQNISGRKTTAELESQIAELKTNGEKVQKSLSPQQKQLMVEGHKLVATKEFGWSRLLFDLERVLPSDVSASRISVDNVFKDGNTVAADLEFAVLSRNYSSVVNMIQRMNNSGIFRAALRSQDLQEGDRGNFSEYTLALTYRPGASYSANPSFDVASAGDEGGAGDE